MEQVDVMSEATRKCSLAKRSIQAVVLVALLVCVSLCLSGCKPPTGQLAANAAIAEMNALEKKDPASISFLPEASQAAQLEQIGISREEFFSWWLEGFVYSLGDLELNFDEDEADINAKITARALEPIIKQWSNEYVEWLVSNQDAIKAGQTEDPCEYGRALLQSLFENTEPVLSECTVKVKKYDDDWSVVADPENGLYRDALLGSIDELSGYYNAPLEELRELGVKLPVESVQNDQAE